jgi:excisionase family DNA binding protein
VARSEASHGQNDRKVGRDGLPLLLTADEAAELLRTSRRGVYAMAERAQLPGAIRIGRRLLVRRDEILLWLGLGEGEKRK